MSAGDLVQILMLPETELFSDWNISPALILALFLRLFVCLFVCGHGLAIAVLGSLCTTLPSAGIINV